VSEEIFDELAQTCANQDEDIPAELEDFVERHGSGRPELATIGFAAALALTSSVAFAGFSIRL
jgi:hypothetical protein